MQIVTSGKDDEEFFRQRGFGIKIGFGERPALIVIDMLKGFTDPAMPLGASLDGEIEAQKPLLEVAHQRDIPVIFSTVMYEEADIKDAGIWALKQKAPARSPPARMRSRSIRGWRCSQTTSCW